MFLDKINVIRRYRLRTDKDGRWMHDKSRVDSRHRGRQQQPKREELRNQMAPDDIYCRRCPPELTKRAHHPGDENIR